MSNNIARAVYRCWDGQAPDENIVDEVYKALAVHIMNNKGTPVGEYRINWSPGPGQDTMYLSICQDYKLG